LDTYNESGKSLLVGSHTRLIDYSENFGVIVDVNSFMSDGKVEGNSLMSFSHD
jgi:hypothetical protein